MARNRPGKRERETAKRNAFQAKRAAIMAHNRETGDVRERIVWRGTKAAVIAAKAERPLYDAPKGFRGSVIARDNLRSASHDIGFVGPRGFVTPKDMVSRQETVNPKRKEVRLGLLSPSRRTQAERESAKALAATVTGFDKETQRD